MPKPRDMIEATEINVDRTAQDGWYVYTSKDMPGLLVANKDDKLAYNDVVLSVRKLYKLDYGVDVTVVHHITHEEFVRRRRLEMRQRAEFAVKERTEHLMRSTEKFIVIAEAGARAFQPA